MVDEKVIEAHQWVVDESERKPAWWVEQTAWAFIAADLVGIALLWHSGWDVFLVAISLVVGTAMILGSRNPALLSASAARAKPFRLFFIAMAAYKLACLVVGPNIGLAAHLLANLLLMSCQYFCACKPPRPRKPRTRTDAQPSAA